ncbi:5360_t:CDS:1, partial [Funneliformis geosporum]
DTLNPSSPNMAISSILEYKYMVYGSMPTLLMKSYKILHCSMNNGLDICTMIMLESILQVSSLNR